MTDAVNARIAAQPRARPRANGPNARYVIWRPAALRDIELQTAAQIVGYALPFHLHETYQFDLMEVGARSYTCANVDRRRIGPGRLIVVNPRECHAVQLSNESNAFRTMHVPVKRLVDAAVRVSGCRQLPIFPLDIDDPEIVQLYLACHRSIEGGPPEQAEGTLSNFLFALVSKFAVLSHGHPHSAAPSPDMLRVRDFFESNLARSITLDEVADITGMSKFYTARQFTKAFGVPPHTFQVRRRLARARELLAAGLAIRCVAVDLGFSDQSHFGRHFLKTFGLSPAEYQQRATGRSREEITLEQP